MTTALSGGWFDLCFGVVQMKTPQPLESLQGVQSVEVSPEGEPARLRGRDLRS